MFCKGAGEIPYQGHKFLTGHCYYGGRITDRNDKRLLLTLLDHHYKGESIGAELESTIYRIPDSPNVDSTSHYIASLPLDTPPQLFGIHPNANIFRKSIAETNNLITGTMMSQTELLEHFRQQGEAQMNRAGLLPACESLLGKIPEPINEKMVLDNFPLSAPNALNLVLYKETLQYNGICRYVSSSLAELTRMLKGEVGSTAELERIKECLAKQLVPKNWMRNAFRTNKNLPGFLQELIERIKFFRSWVEDGEPTALWITAFICPQAVFAALRWNCSNHTKRRVDEVNLKIAPTEFEAKIRQSCLKYSDYCRVSLVGGLVVTLC